MQMPQSLTEFEHTYYYKNDLVKICRQLHLPTGGTKAELNSYLKQYLQGIPAVQIKPMRSAQKYRSLKYDEINLDTKLVGSGFSFNNEARRWFADYFGVKQFSFKKEMVMIKRKAETDNNTELTVCDLIEQMQHWKQSQSVYVAEEQTYQWNNFVRDFFQDSATVQ